MKTSGTEHLTTSEQFLELDGLPRRILFIGGGYIAFEFAHVVRRVGSQATIVHRGSRPLPRFDPDLVDQIADGSRELGIEIQTSTQAERIEKSAGHFVVHASNSGQRRTFQADMVVHAAGAYPKSMI